MAKEKSSPKKAGTEYCNLIASTDEPKKKRTSAYTVFMKDEVPRIKKQFPDLSQKEAFSKAAANVYQV